VSLLLTVISFVPTVRVESWRNYIYVAVWWSPVTCPLQVLRPGHLHTTILRAVPSVPMCQAAPHLNRWTQDLQQLLDSLLFSHRRPDGTVQGRLQRAPWRKSWTFGVPEPFEFVIEPITQVCKALISQFDADVRFGESAAAHVSWV
jgi:hypothetical protein